jgi:phenylpropionate dioxygenase-like ring-hydroxylating dioxygenase large terminal subunit
MPVSPVAVGPDGTNRYIPYQPDKPNRALRLRVYPVREQYGCVFPALSRIDAKTYMAMCKWATQFYEVPASV